MSTGILNFTINLLSILFFFVFVPKGLKIQSMHPLTCYFLSTSSTEKLSFVKNFGGEFTTNRYICYFAVCMLVLINNIL